jgi:chemotaxis protein MotB
MAKLFGFVTVVLAGALAALYFLLFEPQRRTLETTQQDSLQAQRDARICAQEASSLNSRVAELEAMLAETRRTSAQLEAEVAAKEAALAESRATQDELVSELKEEIAAGQVQVASLRGELRVDMVDAILFDSGQAEIKEEGQAVLRRIAEVLARTDKQIEIQGHTDDIPIRGQLAERYPTNWELSSARAVGVTRFLQEHAGLTPDQLSAAGYSEYQPRASNETPEGRQKNRRIEIVLAPRFDAEVAPAAEPNPAEADSATEDQSEEQEE